MLDEVTTDVGTESDWSFPSDWEVEPNMADPHTRLPLPVPQFDGAETQFFKFDDITQAKKLCSVMDLRKGEWVIVMPLHMLTLIRSYVKMRQDNHLWIVRADMLHFS